MNRIVGSIFDIEWINKLIKKIIMKITKIAALLISGFAAGAVTGLLMAPESGKDTRKKLAKEAKKAKKYAEKKAKEFTDKADHFKEKVSEVKENIESVASDVKKKFS